MPRKAAAPAAAEVETPRRSTRISSLPRLTQHGGSRSKKRSAEDGKPVGKMTPNKKAKPDATETGKEEDASGEEELEKLAPIDLGDSLPTLTLKNEKDEDVEVATLAAEKGVILFLVPKADTPGCTTQACGFRDIYPDFTSLNYDVYCLSADTPTAQSKWQTKKELPYPLLSDSKRLLITALGAGEAGKTQRSHFVFEQGGKLVDKKIPVKPADSPKLALEFIKNV